MNLISRTLILMGVLAQFAASQTQSPRGPLYDVEKSREAFAQSVPKSSTFDIVLITIDATQIDRFQLFGGKNPVPMPNLDKLGKRSVVFAQAYSPSPHRQTALVAIHHSLYPTTILGMASTGNTESLASALADAGYGATAIFRKTILDPNGEPIGFINNRFDFDRRRCASRIRLQDIQATFAQNAERRRSGERLFMWLHINCPTPPSRFHPGFRLGSSPDDHYQAALQYADTVVGGVLDDIQKRGGENRTIVTLVGVNGIHDINNTAPGYRQDQLSERTLHVPLMIHVPGISPTRVESLVETVDVAPTLLDFAGTKTPWSFQGRSLLPHIAPGTATEEDRAVFATHLRWAKDTKRNTIQRVKKGDWTLHYGPTLRPSVLRRGNDPSNRIAEFPDKARELGILLENFQIMNECSIWLWSKGEQRAIDLAGADGDIARARFFSRRGDARGPKIAWEIVKRGTANLSEALTLLVNQATQDDEDHLLPLLAHPDLNVRALAGALLLGGSKSESAMDYVSAGLREELSVSTHRALLNALIAKQPKGAEETLLAFLPEGENKDELAAIKDLALAKLGNEEAISRLPMRLLAQNTNYNRLPFFHLLKKLQPERFTGICEIILCHGNGDKSLVQAAIQHLFETDSRKSAFAVARAITPNTPVSVRTQAINLLNYWQSHEGISSCLDLGQGSDFDTDLAARVLFRTPSVLGSPIIPSMRFDHFASDRSDGDLKAIAKEADLTKAPLKFSLQVPQSSYPKYAVLFRATDLEGKPFDVDSLQLSLSVNEKGGWLTKGRMTSDKGLICFVGSLPQDRLEPGTNTFSLRLKNTLRKKTKAYALGFVLFPRNRQIDQPVVGLDTNPIGESTPVRAAAGYLKGDARSHLLWIRRDGLGKPSGEVRVMANGRTFLRFALAALKTPRTIEIKLPENTARDSKIELICVDVPKNMAVTALLLEQQ